MSPTFVVSVSLTDHVLQRQATARAARPKVQQPDAALSNLNIQAPLQAAPHSDTALWIREHRALLVEDRSQLRAERPQAGDMRVRHASIRVVVVNRSDVSSVCGSVAAIS